MTAQQLLDDQKGMFRDFPTEIAIIAGAEIACLPLSCSAHNEWLDGGQLDTPSASIAIEREAFDVLETTPKQGDTINFRGFDWEIVAIQHDHSTSPVRIDLRNATK